MINFDILRRACKTDEEREAIATLERTVNQIRDMPPEKRAAWAAGQA
jgi:molybdopterin converting factor small subunit